jgi:hypothetical protein
MEKRKAPPDLTTEEERKATNLGWLAQSTIAPKKPKLIEG